MESTVRRIILKSPGAFEIPVPRSENPMYIVAVYDIGADFLDPSDPVVWYPGNPIRLDAPAISLPPIIIPPVKHKESGNSDGYPFGATISGTVKFNRFRGSPLRIIVNDQTSLVSKPLDKNELYRDGAFSVSVPDGYEYVYLYAHYDIDEDGPPMQPHDYFFWHPDNPIKITGPVMDIGTIDMRQPKFGRDFPQLNFNTARMDNDTVTVQGYVGIQNYQQGSIYVAAFSVAPGSKDFERSRDLLGSTCIAEEGYYELILPRRKKFFLVWGNDSGDDGLPITDYDPNYAYKKNPVSVSSNDSTLEIDLIP